jgi:hypothetical protein
MTYAIFKVYDYKGGELNASTNLDKEELISNLAEIFERYNDCDYDYDDDDDESVKEDESDKEEGLKKDLESIKTFINECLSRESFFSTYAGGDGFCGEIYEVEGDKMEEVSFTSFLEEIAQYIFENWFEDEEEN